MKFIHVTDLHLVAPGQTLWGIDPAARLRACLDDILAYHSDAAFVAITGDLTERGDPASYGLLREMLSSFPLETHLMIGNHDDRANFRAVMSDHPVDPDGHIQHAIERDDCHFLFLDTLKGPPSSAGLYDAARQDWLRNRLEAAGSAPVYLFMHHPPFPIAHPLMDLIALEDGEAFAGLLVGHDVRHIFFGHGHRAVSGRWRGISYSAEPSLAHQLPLSGTAVPTVYSHEPPAYGVVHLLDDQIVVHSDCFLNRHAADMAPDAERGDWY